MSTRKVRSRLLGVVLAGGFAAGLAAVPVSADGHVETVVSFDPDSGELPEGVTVDKKGNVFASLSPLGQLVKIPAGSSAAEPFGAVEGLEDGDLGLLGLAVDAPGNVYGTVVSANADAQGVWMFDRKTGEETRVSGTEAISFPNSIAFDKRGNMYITDTVLGAVWTVPKGGSAEPWIVDPLLQGDGSFGFGFDLGANGIAVKQGTIYVGVTEQGSIVTIPINTNGSAGTAQILVQEAGWAVDGLALDVHGNVYFANPIPSAVIKVAPDGSYETIATDADGLDRPTSVAFGTGRGAKQSLYVANFSVALGPPIGTGPSVVAVDVGVPGWPVP